MSKLIIIGDNQTSFPENMEQMNQRCKDVNTLQQCVKSYAQDCLTKTARQTVSVLIYGIVRTNKMYCSNRKRKLGMIKLGQCGHDMPRASKAMMDMVKSYHAIRFFKEKNLRIPLGCCNFYKMKSITMGIVEELCPELLEETERLLDGFSKDTLNVMCGDYTEDSDKCSQIIHKTPKWNKPLEYNSFVIPLAQVFENLDD